MNIYKRLLFPFLCLLFVSEGFTQQMTRVHGKVIDAKTKEPLPFVNVTFLNVNVGTTTDFDGKYLLETKWAADELQASFVGYTPLSKKIEKGVNQRLNFELQPTSINLETITVKARKKRYKNKDNPAVALIKKVIQNKSKNRKSALDYYEYEKYEKVGFDLNNFSEDFRDKSYMKSFQFVFEDYIDTSTVNGKPFIPIFLRESASRVYFRKSPKATKEYLEGTRMTGHYNRFDDDGVTSVMEKLYSNIDIYDNEIELLSKRFPSPINSFAPLIYKYFIVDTVDVNQKSCINLAFFPRVKSDFAFTGNLYVLNDSSSYAVVKVKLGITDQINLNFVDDLAIDQEFELYQDSLWMLSKDEMVIDYNISDKGMGLFGKKAVSYRNYVFNQEREDTIYNKPENLIKEAVDISNRNDAFWAEARHSNLSEKEQGTYDMIDSIQNTRVFKTVATAADILTSGWIPFNKFEIGPISTLVSYNEVEGMRYRIGGRTNTHFHNKLQIETHLALGSNDQMSKYNLGLNYSLNQKFNTNPQHRLGGSISKEMVFPGQGLKFLNDDNFLLSFKRGDSQHMLLFQTIKFYYLRELKGGFSYQLSFRNRKQSPKGQLKFEYALEKDQKKNLVTDDLILKLRYAPHERFYQTKNFRRPLYNEHPIFELEHTQGFKGLFGGQYNYGRTTFNVFKRVHLSFLGFTDLRIEMGKVWGKRIPFPLLSMPESNQTFSLQETSFNMMNFMEFVCDEYASIKMTHFFKGAILNKIPLLNKWKLRETMGLKAVVGSLSDGNNPTRHDDLLRFPLDKDGKPITFSLDGKAYVEASVGLSNILKIFRVDLVQRLTHLDEDKYQVKGLWGINGLGLRAKATFDF